MKIVRMVRGGKNAPKHASALNMATAFQQMGHACAAWARRVKIAISVCLFDVYTV